MALEYLAFVQWFLVVGYMFSSNIRKKIAYVALAGIPLIAYITLVHLQLTTYVDDPGVGWHLLTGQYIFKNSAIPFVDPFLCHATATRWIADQWFADLLLFIQYYFGGWAALYAMGINIYFLAFVVLPFLIANRYLIKHSTGEPAIYRNLIAVCAAFLTFKLGLIHFILRPVLFGHLCFAVVYLSLRLFLDRRANDIPDSHISAIVPALVGSVLVFMLWANLHPSFFLGIGLFVAALFGGILDKFVFHQNWPSNRTLGILLVILTASVSTFINPFGVELHRQALELGQSQFFMTLNLEWRPIDMRSLEGKFFLSSIGLIMAGSFLSPNRLKDVSTFDVITYGTFAYLTTQSVRFLPFYAIAGAPFFALSISSVIAALRRQSVRSNGVLERDCHGMQIVMGMSAILLIAVCIQAWTLRRIFFFDGEFGPRKEKFPVAAFQKLAELPGEVKVVYSTPDWGGFLALSNEEILSGHGAEVSVRPVIDDRNSMNGEAPYRNYKVITGVEDGWLEKVMDLPYRYLLFPVKSPINTVLSPYCNLLYRDDVAVLWEKKSEFLPPDELRCVFSPG